jgi:hypothetical protein
MSFKINKIFTCWVVSKQYSAVHRMLQILHVSISFNFLDESRIEEAPVDKLPMPAWAVSLSMFWIWKFWIILDAAPLIAE